jgi:anti-sigma regulatory factor (Ser/Thr protein kinase)
VLYSGADGLVQGLVPWIEDGLSADDPVVAVVTARSGDALRSALGTSVGRVHIADMGELGRNPARIISVWRTAVEQHRKPGKALRAIGEPVWPGRSPDELVECIHHERLLNTAFADCDDLWLLCPYDVSALADDLVAGVGLSHPSLLDGASRFMCGDYPGQPHPASVLGDPLPPPLEPLLDEMVVDRAALPELRARVEEEALDFGLGPARARDLVLAVSELATNSILHGGGYGRLRAWAAAGSLVYEVCDRGHVKDPLIGRRRPTPDQLGGRGVWLVNELCDLVQYRSSAFGTIVRVHMRPA